MHGIKNIWSDEISVKVLWSIAFQRIDIRLCDCHFSFGNFEIQQQVDGTKLERSLFFYFAFFKHILSHLRATPERSHN